MELFTRIRETNLSSLIYFFIFPENKIQVKRDKNEMLDRSVLVSEKC